MGLTFFWLLLPSLYTRSSFNVIDSLTYTAEKTGSLSHPSPVPYWPSRVDNDALKTVWDFCLLSSRGHLQSCVSDSCCLQAFVPVLRLPSWEKYLPWLPICILHPAFSMCLTFSSPARYVRCFFPFLFRRNAMKVCAIFSRAVTLLAIRGINHSDLMTHPAHESFSSLPKPKPGMLGLFLLSSCWSKAVLESGQICQLQHFDLSLWSR